MITMIVIIIVIIITVFIIESLWCQVLNYFTNVYFYNKSVRHALLLPVLYVYVYIGSPYTTGSNTRFLTTYVS